MKVKKREFKQNMDFALMQERMKGARKPETDRRMNNIISTDYIESLRLIVRAFVRSLDCKF